MTPTVKTSISAGMPPDGGKIIDQTTEQVQGQQWQREHEQPIVNTVRGRQRKNDAEHRKAKHQKQPVNIVVSKRQNASSCGTA